MYIEYEIEVDLLIGKFKLNLFATDAFKICRKTCFFENKIDWILQTCATYNGASWSKKKTFKRNNKKTRVHEIRENLQFGSNNHFYLNAQKT